MEPRVGRIRTRLPTTLRPLVDLGALPADRDELRVRKAVLVLSSTLMTTFAVVWVVTYAALGLWVPAAIPFAYQLASAASIWWFARTKRYILFRRSQLLLSLVLPFVLQWSLGGFQASSAVALWAFTCPLGALLFVGARQAFPWFAAFAGLVVVSAVIDSALADHAADVPDAVVVTFFALNILGVAATTYALLQYFVRARERALAESERLLLNVLPAPVAARLKEHEGILAEDCPAVTVLFADLVGFTQLAERLPAAEVVTLLDRVFAAWDAVVAEHGVEKIKTIGDAYMAVSAGGIGPLCRLALDMRTALDQYNRSNGTELSLRIGIHAGPAVAGVLGIQRFLYDVWGDTVNVASRLESTARPGGIQVSEAVMRQAGEDFAFEARGRVELQGRGLLPTYWLIGTATTGSSAGPA